jgi:hypothetical protein
VKANSVTEVLRMRRLSSMVVSALVPSTWPTAVLIGPPLHDTARAVDLVYITAEGRVLR